MNVTKRNGKTESFNEEKILACVRRACDGDEDVVQKIYWNMKLNLYDGVKTREIDESVIKSARTLIEKDPRCKYVAAKLLLATVYKEVFGEGADSDAFVYSIKRHSL